MGTTMLTPQDRARSLVAGLSLTSPHQTDEQLIETLAGQIAAAVRDVLRRVGKPDRCPGCGETLYLVRHLGDPHYKAYGEADGIQHSATCPDGPEFSGKPRDKNP